ncbi:hypothetical protein Fcan01_20712 [Folsomia candida]|uniref:Uncharacterized protein n=1 Tax=Folsomia candida TaxID=158441 RepID=A0A226DII9_FOLCA|nr:hypothetical protein Fcan01_20712 [Folsomia candida]
MTALSLISFLLRFEISPDYVQGQLLNFIFSTKDIQYRQSIKHLLRFLVLFFDLIELGFYLFPTLHGLLTIFLPCQPGLLSSILCSRNDIFLSFHYPKYLVFFAALLEFLLFMQVAVGASYNIISVLLTGVTFLWIECTTFIQRYEILFVSQVGYRKVQIFEKLLNASTRESIFLKTALLLPALQIIMSFVTINMFHASQGLMTLMFLWLYVLAFSFTLLTFSAAAKANGASHGWIARCKGGDGRKIARKFHRSLVPLRLRYGNNFVEVLTPLVVQEFCMRQTMSFLIVRK